MLTIGMAGATLILMSHLENKGKISINRTILNILIIAISIFAGWGILGKIINNIMH